MSLIFLREHRQRQVLVADNDASVGELLVECLVSELGVRVDHVADGQEAVARLRRQSYALAIIDPILPKVPGFALAEPAMGRDTPVMFICSHPAACDQCIKFNLPHLIKPFAVDLFVKCASGIIHRPADTLHRLRTCPITAWSWRPRPLGSSGAESRFRGSPSAPPP